jgi:fucose permease
LILLCVLFFIQGFAQGSTDLGGTNLIFTMWGVNAAAPLNTAHLGYGIGAVFVNLLVRPFLTGQTNITSITVTVDSVVNSSSTSDNVIKANSNIFVPYSITAALCILIAVGHIFFYIRALKSQREKLEVRQVMKIFRENDSIIHIDV